MSRISGILFDKDGTLFDFYATWGAWTAGLLEELAQGDAAFVQRMGESIGYDITAGRFHRDSIVIAATPREIASRLLPMLQGLTLPALIAIMNERAASAPQAEAVPLRPLLVTLRQRGLWLGLATNDAEGPARAHLETAGVTEFFDFIAGSDSGFGEKPEPGMLLRFADHIGCPASEVLMIGDSRHDLVAGRAAGMRPVAVLTGIAPEEDLTPLAEAVLPDIGHLPEWLDQFEIGRFTA